MLFAYLYTYAHTCTHIDKYNVTIQKDIFVLDCMPKFTSTIIIYYYP